MTGTLWFGVREAIGSLNLNVNLEEIDDTTLAIRGIAELTPFDALRVGVSLKTPESAEVKSVRLGDDSAVIVTYMDDSDYSY